ncbi:unnamed protein product [Diatraea saccharalis]|uniref:NudC domain-containing protein 1 n=1 Tax=Diatraea saccharalis TaxID=40085 RepID=A0A9N9QU79_9NEOP|nr:unnamed protein product [Diatraea saccharalis]
MPSSLVDLRPNRRLLDHDFEGYKLNLQALPHFKFDLVSPVDRLFPDEVQFSFIHAKLFALHNHLVMDYWDYSYNFYYIDKKQQVRQISFENTTNSFENNVVYDVPAYVERKSGHFDLCLSFPSQSVAVVSDGTGYLHIVDTGVRNCRNRLWQTQHSTLVLGESKFFIIIDSRIQEKSNKEILHCLIQSVEQKETHFNSVLSLVTFENDNNSWKQISIKQMEGKGIVHYAAIESSCEAAYIASDNIFKFTYDSENEIIETLTKVPQKLIYTWMQTSEDISITLKLDSGCNKNLMHVNVMPLHIKVSYGGNTFIDGKLKHKIDSELTTWNIQDNGQVDILLTKSESSLWDEFLEGGDNNGEQIMDASLVEEVHWRLSHLCSETEVSSDQSVPGFSTQELEECDAASEEDTVLVRLDTTTHCVTHRVPLSVHQYLFSLKLDIHEVPAIGLRHDVDACIWQPYAKLINSDTWPLKHQGTLMAFGYVQSSKQNRKFITCPPNFSYSVVCEATKHLFIYQSSINPDCQLRKKTAGVMQNVKVGQQHVFNFDKYGEIIGINATNEYLFLLTENSLIAIQIL